MKKLIGFAFLMMGVAGVAFAGGPAPEIDPSAAVGAIALLGGGALVIRGRRRKR
jgi:LPXTG-motif cell wall-anchored protein